MRGEQNRGVSGGEVGSLCLPPRFGGEWGAAREGLVGLRRRANSSKVGDRGVSSRGTHMSGPGVSFL